jgi:hypothetical protein
VNYLAGDIQCQLKEKCKDFLVYPIATDENTDITDIGQHAAFIRGVDKDIQLVVELLELVPMKGKTGADDFFFSIGDSF